jgi:S-adenosylmethionine:tRNA ribosyltransferase-isomerase
VKLSDFDFDLPEELIAQAPLPQRDHSRLLVVRRDTGRIEHRLFRDLPSILGTESFLVLNSTRVFPARVWANRPGKRERIEVLFGRESGPGEWLALIKPGRKAPLGQELQIGTLVARVIRTAESGARTLRLQDGTDLISFCEESGEPPLPPYIHRAVNQTSHEDRERYQTVYANQTGSIAAPTAGLHFTAEVLGKLREKGVPVCEITLHVGYGTFQPVRCEEIEAHRMEPEVFALTDEAAASIGGYKAEGRRLVAVGTTTTRVLEYLARSPNPFAKGRSGLCDLFIYPGFEFREVDALLTNFHLPRSTLLMLVSAFAGQELTRGLYREAIAERYRFFSYGDCMLIL